MAIPRLLWHAKVARNKAEREKKKLVKELSKSNLNKGQRLQILLEKLGQDGITRNS